MGSDTCRHHPQRPAAALCQKYNYGLCAQCLEQDPRCADPEIYCKFRPQCLIHFQYKESGRGAKKEKTKMIYNGPYADFIKKLPQPELPLEGASAHLLTGPKGQVAFFEVPAGAEFPMHSHGAQWGIIVEGEAEFNIDGQVRLLKKGDSYNIGEGVEHGIKILTDLKAIDVFEDPNRYQAKD